MTIMIDATNISVGGGLQVSVSVINELLSGQYSEDFIFVVSENVYRQLKIPHGKDSFVICKSLIKSNPFYYSLYIGFMRRIENKYNVSLVFSVFGPTYWRPGSAYHLIGFANAWLVYPDLKIYNIFGPIKKLLMILKNTILARLLFYSSAHYVTETNAVKSAFCKKFRCNSDVIDVVPNCISQEFKLVGSDFFNLGCIEKFKFVTISHNYPHKNLKIISKVGDLLSAKGLDFTFLVTIPNDEYELLDDKFKLYTHNIGPVDLSRCGSVYEYSDALFLPTLIECFTVSYLEAFYAKKPILTSGLDFAFDICGDSAFYFDPYNVESIANTCIRVINSKNSNEFEINEKIKKYQARIDVLISNEQRVSAYLKIMDKILAKNDK